MKNCKKIKTLVLLALASTSASVLAAPGEDKSDYVADFSNPMAIYSEAGIGGSNDGLDLYGAFCGYLGGTFAHKIRVEGKDDLEYYKVNYLAVDTSTDTGFMLDTTWNQDDYRKVDEVNDTSIGVIKKIPLMNDRLNLYPKLKLGWLWGDEIKNTTYISADAAVRFNVTSGFWVGGTPKYTYGMKGLELREWSTSVDVGYQFKQGIGLSAQTILDSHEDTQFRANLTFAF